MDSQYEKRDIDFKHTVLVISGWPAPLSRMGSTARMLCVRSSAHIRSMATVSRVFLALRLKGVTLLRIFNELPIELLAFPRPLR